MYNISFKRKGTNKVLEIRNQEVPFLSFPKLEAAQIVTHGFSTRLGGVSEGIFSSMNLGFTRGDKEESVHENYKRIAASIGFSYNNIVCADQTHTSNIRNITAKDIGKGVTKPRDYSNIDGLITNVPGIALCTVYADCVPLYFIDPINKAIGLSHSGWKGTVGKIGKITIEAMKKEFNTNSKDIIAAIGPSICMDCYEVSQDVAARFQNNFPPSILPEILYQKESGKYQLDLWKANEAILLESGVLPENIQTTDICTCCNSTLLFSHRASQGKRGNLAAFLCLNT